MKIARVEANWVHVPLAEDAGHRSDFGHIKAFDSAIVRIETECGLVGWGEGKNAAGSSGRYAALVHLINVEFGPAILGKDPRDISAIWEMLYSGGRAHYAVAQGRSFPDLARRGHSIAAISAIDIALWDILGKSLGAPVWRLLGGRRAERLPAYASGGWANAEGIGAELNGYIQRSGFKAVKMRVGAMDPSIRHSAERVIAARKAIGPDVQLMCDAHGSYGVSDAKRFCHMVRDCDLTWFEEPVSGDDKTGMAEVRAATHIPIAAGESEYTRFDFRDLISARAVDVLQPDLAVCGGLSEGVRIGALASAHNLRLAPHLWAGAAAFAAGMHLAAASPAGFLLEYPVGANPMLQNLIEERFAVQGGMVDIPDRPGLGITVREDFVRQYAKAVM